MLNWTYKPEQNFIENSIKTLALNDILKRKLQINSFIYNISLYGSSYWDVFPYLSHCEMFWKNDCIRQKLLEQLHSCTYETEVIHTNWLIHHSFHECSITTQTFLKCNWYVGCFSLLPFDFILCLYTFPSRGGKRLILSSKYNIEQVYITLYVIPTM